MNFIDFTPAKDQPMSHLPLLPTLLRYLLRLSL
jgi:hypothetical protein